ncbi:MAG: glycosyltransferase family 4 protein [Gammaproteobacteria bacterium]|nr:glycosyltransferase family 4 protein [Gammaproteobacteria bacterium]MCW8922093.1 glycosyltransferase family 4 protein [Gammaproteobacteria bacterium]
MKVISLCLSESLGGLELYALRSTVQLSKNNDVLFITSADAMLNERLQQNNISIRHLKPSFRPLPIISAHKLAHIIDEFNADVIHMHWGKDLPLVSLSIKISKKKPAMVYTRQMQITRMKTDFYHRFLYKEMSLMLAITHQLRDCCTQMLGDGAGNHVETLYYGVAEPDQPVTPQEIADRRGQLGLDKNDFVVGLFGRLEDQKGQHLLIKAIAQAKQKNINLNAIIVGHEMETGYRNELKQLAQDYDISQHIIFMDFVEKPQEIMQLCDCVLLATYMETFGLVLPEAMRCSIAVIGSNAGGVPEIIDHDETGLLFEPKNVDDLEKQITLLFKDKEKRQQLAIAGKQKADTVFNNEQHFEKLQMLLEKQIKH